MTEPTQSRIERIDAVTTRYYGPVLWMTMGPMFLLSGIVGLVTTGKPWIWGLVVFGVVLIVVGALWFRSRRRGVPDGLYGSAPYPPAERSPKAD